VPDEERSGVGGSAPKKGEEKRGSSEVRDFYSAICIARRVKRTGKGMEVCICHCHQTRMEMRWREGKPRFMEANGIEA